MGAAYLYDLILLPLPKLCSAPERLTRQQALARLPDQLPWSWEKALLSRSPWWHPLPGQPLSQVASAPGLWELSSPVFVSWYCQRLPPVANFWFLFSSVWLLRVSSTCGNHLSALHSLCCKRLKWFLFYGHPGDAVPTALSLCLIPLCT